MLNNGVDLNDGLLIYINSKDPLQKRNKPINAHPVHHFGSKFGSQNLHKGMDIQKERKGEGALIVPCFVKGSMCVFLIVNINMFFLQIKVLGFS